MRLFWFVYDDQWGQLPLMLYSNRSHRTVDVDAVVKEFISLQSSRNDDFRASCEQAVHVDDAMQCLMCRSDFNLAYLICITNCYVRCLSRAMSQLHQYNTQRYPTLHIYVGFYPRDARQRGYYCRRVSVRRPSITSRCSIIIETTFFSLHIYRS